MEDYSKGDLVWFDPGVSQVIPGEVVEFNKSAQVVTVQAIISNEPQTFTITNMTTVKRRQDLGQNGLEDMIDLVDLNEASLLWNLKIRYDKQMIYTYTGSILVAVNPYRMSDIYGLDMVKKYEGQILGSLPPHLFAVGSCAYSKMNKDTENQCVIISGESGAGKTESTKLIMQYLAAVNKSPSNLITEQILEASPLLESFGNAKTVRNDNSSRFGKYVEVFFKDGIITGARTTQYLLEKSRIVTQAQDERNYHVFYELLVGLTEAEKKKYGLQSADDYFYLNQGGATELEGKYDSEDFQSLLSAMQVLGLTNEEQGTIFKILSSVLHLGNIYFHRKPLKHGTESVEVGSDSEIKWCSHLLQIPIEGILQSLTTKTTEARNERLLTPLNIDQALDARDAFAKALYSSLFTWLVKRVNQIVCKGSKRQAIAILDIFGFEDFKENSFEQLCINYANETLQFHFNKHIFRLEQQEYQKEKITWQVINYQDNQPVINLIAKKPVGIFHLLDDESNFPKATDQSFLEKCHYNHALNELYSRPRMSSMEFGIKHYAGQVWYSVENFLDKNRDTLRHDVVSLLIGSKIPMISNIFQDMRENTEAAKTVNKSDGRFITMKPRTPTVGARFHDSLLSLLESMSRCHPWFVRCIKPNNMKAPMKFDMDIVLEQLRYSGMLETIRIRKIGYPIRMKFSSFTDRYRCLLRKKVPKGAPTREVCKVILDSFPETQEHYQLGSTKVFLRESLEYFLEKERMETLRHSVIVIQKYVRGRIARRRYWNMRIAIVIIQSAYRGYSARRDYQNLRNGVIKAQAIYRMMRQKREYHKLRIALVRKREAEIAAKERAKIVAVEQEKERASKAIAVAGVNHLEIPAELAFIFSKLDEWQAVHNERNINKVVGRVAHLYDMPQLPHDTDLHAFTKYINVYFKAHLWGMKREPIKTPFLSKSSETDYQDSLAIFKLILRFMNDNNLSGKKEAVLGDYIVQKGIQNEKMRDEILCQLCNQTWKNENDANNERGWILMANCLSAFPPSKTLYKYLLKYVSDHAYNGYKSFCQHQLLQSAKVDAKLTRTYPTSLLEWRANKKRANMALEAKFADGESMYGAVDSWTTGHSFAANLIRTRGIQECSGWTVSLHDENAEYELNGNDYVMDLISEMEIPPAFPHCQSHFLVSHDKDRSSKSQSAAGISLPHRPDIEKELDIQIENIPPSYPLSRRQMSSDLRSEVEESLAPSQMSHVTETTRQRIDVSISELSSNFNEPTGRVKDIKESLLQKQSKYHHPKERLGVNHTSENASFGLSKTSALNERYFDDEVGASEVDNKMKFPPSAQLQNPKEALSETSKLNKRYMMKSQSHEELDRDRERTNEWNKYGLSQSTLNVRYFQQNEQPKADGSDAGSDIRAPSGLTSNDLNRTILSRQEDVGGSIDFPELEMEEAGNDANSGTETDGEKFSRGSSSRFVKNAPKPSQPQRPHSHSTKAYIETRHHQTENTGSRAHSSAMSDTSEAPSLASHVRGIKIPSHTSELDQYLDDLFNPVLDGNLDDLSDIRSLAASIKGGKKKKQETDVGDLKDDEIDDYLTSLFSKISELSDSDSDSDSNYAPDLPLVRRPSVLRQGRNDENVISSYNLVDSSIDDLNDPEALASAIKGGSQGAAPPQPGMQPLPPMGLNMGFTSPIGSPAMNMFGSGMMFNQSMPIPVYNNAGVQPNATVGFPSFASMPIMPLFNSAGAGVPGGVLQQQTPTPNPSMDQGQFALQQQMFQRAFLASTVQQNFQIQQQLMQQNQALQQLITGQMAPGPYSPQPASQPSQPTSLLYVKTDPSPKQERDSQMPPTPQRDYSRPTSPPSVHGKSQGKGNISPASSFGDVLAELKNRNGSVSGDPPPLPKTQPPRMVQAPMVPPPPPPPPPPMPGDPDSPDEQVRVVTDIYGREKTIRIGKWRWPPPRGEDGNPNTSFFAFKMQKQQEKNDIVADELMEDGYEGFEYRDVDPENFQSPTKIVTKGPYDEPEEMPVRDGEKVIRAFDGEDRPDPGSIRKLQISNEMKAKLEQLTMDHSVRSTRKDDRGRVIQMSSAENLKAPENDNKRDVKKLAANRKALLEAQLSGSIRKHQDETDASPQRQPRPMSQEFYTNEARINKMESKDDSHNFKAPPTRPFGDSSRLDSRFSQSAFTVNYSENESEVAPLNDHHDASSWATPRDRRYNSSKAPSTVASSSYYTPSTPVVPQQKKPPPPIIPERVSSRKRYHSDQIEIEESSEFLRPVDDTKLPIVDAAESKTLESIKTKFFPQTTAPFFSYNRVSWTLNVRKEVFSPLERIENPLSLHLIFCQIVQDVFSKLCLRISKEDRRKMRHILDGYGINPTNIVSHNHKNQIKKNVVEIAREWPNYFSRLFPVRAGGNEQSNNLAQVQLLGVSHSGVRFVRKVKGTGTNSNNRLAVLQYISLEEIVEVLVPRQSTVRFILKNGEDITVYTHQANIIKNMLTIFLYETQNGSGEEYLRAVSDYITRESTLLSFRKGDIIRIETSTSQHLEKGWLYGQVNGHVGIFPMEYVAPIGRQEATQILNMKESGGKRGSTDGRVFANRLDDSWIESKDHFEERSGLNHTPPLHEGKYSLLQYALFHFSQSLQKYEVLQTADGSIRGSIKLIESLKVKKKKGKKSKDGNDWTWKEQAEMVKFTRSPIQMALLKLPNTDLNKLAIECFTSIMRYMGDYPLSKGQNEVDCVYTILMSCHKHPELRDEIYCQIMKQTTNNKSPKPDSCQKGWRLFSIIASYFDCSDVLKSYLFQYLETAAYDNRRAFHGTAMVCLQNLRKTFKFGGRKNVPSVEEIMAISAGRNSKRQMYRLPGGTERVINTKSTTIVNDIIEEICSTLDVRNQFEMEEFSLYCIVEGEMHTMPLSREEYILDVTTELLKNGHIFYLIFCRTVWYYMLRLDNQLYIEVNFNQIAPDYIEGLLLVMPGEQIQQEQVYDIARTAALLHRTSDMKYQPTVKEIKYLLPKPVLRMNEVKAQQWLNMIQSAWSEVESVTTDSAKAQILEILERWELFGSCFFAVRRISNMRDKGEQILALNKNGVHFLDLITHESIQKYPFSEVISTRKVKAEDGTLYLDMKCGNLMVQKISRLQTEQAYEISRLIRQYINVEQRHMAAERGDAPRDVTLTR